MSFAKEATLKLVLSVAPAACGARTLLETGQPLDAATAAPADTRLGDATEVDVAPPPVPQDPFRPGDRWIGTYTCPQGLTQLDLQIVSTSGNDITDAIFNFNWGSVTGAFHLSGVFDPGTLFATFVPGAWIVMPTGWVTVGMQGNVALSTMSYVGEITANPPCGSFSVTRTP